MRHRTPALVFLGLSVILFAVTLAMGVRTIGRSRARTAEGPGTAAVQTEAPASQEESDGGGLFGLFSPNTPEPTAIPEPTPTPVPTATPWPGPEVPEQSAEAGPEYFADAAFLGNSVLSGLWYYDYDGLLPKDDTHWFWEDGLTVLGASSYAARMSGNTYGKIYVGFGCNEMSYDKATLREAFNSLLDQLEADHPGSIIYLVAVSPVSLWKSTNDRYFTKDLVLAFNDMLRDIARQRQVWFLDIYPVLCNEDGYLPSDVTPDGIHFTPAHYENWFNYMKTHYIPTGTEGAQTTGQAAPQAG